jgi:hypothetical protein
MGILIISGMSKSYSAIRRNCKMRGVHSRVLPCCLCILGLRMRRKGRRDCQLFCANLGKLFWMNILWTLTLKMVLHCIWLLTPKMATGGSSFRVHQLRNR